MSPRPVVMLSPGGRFTDEVLALMVRRGVSVDALVLYVPALRGAWRRAPGRLARLRALVLTPLRWARVRVKQRTHAVPAGAAARVLRTGALNGARMKRDLLRLRPDVLVLARCGLVDPEVVAIPREGVVNVHPGLLPWIRGNSPVASSLLRGVPLGATAFRVDAGIDTGPVLARRLVRLGGSETVAEVREALFRLWVEMTADLVADACAGRLPSGVPQRERFPLCRTLAGPADLAAMDHAVRRGDAKALLDRWAPLCDPSNHSLAPDADASPIARPAG
jgi:folate-dependent phosphoribosylglycinamide formyltransferase PurN